MSAPILSPIGALCLSVALCSPAVSSQAQETTAPTPAVEVRQVERTPTPAWVIDYTADPTLQPRNEAEAGDTFFPLIERQYDAASRTNYYRYLKRLEGESALQEGAQLTFGFDPHHETLEIHRLLIHRNGEVIDRLAGQEFKVLQREEDHERQLYDDTLSAIAVLEDIRSGDVIEYAFSVRGENPVFEDHFYWTLTTSYTVPVGVIHGVLRHPSEDKVKIVQHVTASEAALSDEGSTKIHRWIIEHPVPLPSEGGLPPEYDPWGWIEATSFQSWEEVSAWARKQYIIPSKLPDELLEASTEISKTADKESQILAALRFAQDEVRYLGIFDGVHSHQPYPLETIIKRRFGDCKDKTLLLVSLLRHLGFEAWPALVNTDYGPAISNWTPSPHAFDHLVTVVRHGNRDYWLDPTASYQRGPLSSLFFPDYGHALVLHQEGKGAAELTRVTPQGFAESSTRIKEIFRIPDYRGEAKLEVESVYQGDEADTMRSYFASSSRAEIQRKYVNFYSSTYEGIESVKDFEVDDDERKNIVTVREYYHIPQIWEDHPDNAEKLEAEFPSKYTYDEVDIPSTKKRTMPYAISHPVDISHRLEVHMPAPMDEEPVTRIIEDQAFRFEYRETYEGSVNRIDFSYKSLNDRIEPGRIAEYLRNAKKSESLTNYKVWISRDTHEGLDTSDQDSTPYRFNWTLAVITLLSLAGGGLAALILSHLKVNLKPKSFYDPSLDGISGWLILIAFGVWSRVIFGAVVAFTNVYNYDLDTWNALTESDGDSYHELWAPFILLESVLDSLWYPFTILGAILFHRKHVLFPPLMVGIFLFEFITEAIYCAAAHHIAGAGSELAEEYLGNFSPCIFGVLIWVPYLLVSKRVGSTFRRGGLNVGSPPPLPGGIKDIPAIDTSPPA